MLCNNRNKIVKNDVNRRLVVRRHHIGEDGRIRLKCTASVLDLYWRTAEEVAQVTKQAIGNGQFFTTMRFNVFLSHDDATLIFLPIGTVVSAQPSRPIVFPLFFFSPILRTDGFVRSLKKMHILRHTHICNYRPNDAIVTMHRRNQLQRLKSKDDTFHW